MQDAERGAGGSSIFLRLFFDLVQVAARGPVRLIFLENLEDDAILVHQVCKKITHRGKHEYYKQHYKQLRVLFG